MVNTDGIDTKVKKPNHRNFDDLTGRNFGRLYVVAYAGRKKRNDSKGYRHYWLCDCVCQNVTIEEGDSLARNRTVLQSCGCLRKEGNHTGHFKPVKMNIAEDQYSNEN